MKTLLIRTGPGSERAASGLRSALREFMPRLIVNFGTAGAIADDLQSGDCVISRESVAYDPVIFGADGENEANDSLMAPEEIRLCEDLESQIAEMPESRLAVFGSADYPVADEHARLTLRALFDLDVVDFETHSVLCVARQAKIHAFSFRAITDLAGPDAEQEFLDNHRRIVESAGRRLGELLERLDLKRLKQDFVRRED